MWLLLWLHTEGGAMTTIGVRELKNQATEVLREVRECEAEYIVTYRGKPVALLVPMSEKWQKIRQERQVATKRAQRQALRAEMNKLREEISHHATGSLVETLLETRRERDLTLQGVLR
jgi:prevent-host-death family protein